MGLWIVKVRFYRTHDMRGTRMMEPARQVAIDHVCIHKVLSGNVCEEMCMSASFVAALKRERRGLLL